MRVVCSFSPFGPWRRPDLSILGGTDVLSIQCTRWQQQGALHFDDSPGRRHGPACNELEKREATKGFRGLRNRVQRAGIQQVLAGDESHWLPGPAVQAIGSADREHQGAVPEVPVGAFSEKRRDAGQVHLPRDADVHGWWRGAEQGRGTERIPCVDARDAPRQTECGIYARLRFLAELREGVCAERQALDPHSR